MEDLVKAFFERDLNESEERELDSLLESSREEAFHFLDRAKALYVQTGLPNPENPPLGGASVSSLGGGTKLLLSFTAGALLTGSAWWYWAKPSQQEQPNSSPIPKMEAPVPKPQPLPQKSGMIKPKADTAKPPVTAQPMPFVQGKKYGGLSVIVDQTSTDLATLRILDSGENEVRLLFASILDKGKWAMEWDGRKENGELAEAGTYQVEIQSGKTVLRKEIRMGLEPVR